MQTPCRERQLPWDDTLPRGLPRKPTLQTAAEFPGLPVFWEFVAQALLDESSAVAICHTFELGGTMDALGDGAFVRDEIMVSFLLHDDLERVVWHCLSFSWLGAKPPIAGFERRTSRDPSVAPAPTWSQRSACLGSGSGARPVCRVLGLFRLQPSQDGVFLGWFSSVPNTVAALRSGVSPQTHVKIVRRVGSIGVLTTI